MCENIDNVCDVYVHNRNVLQRKKYDSTVENFTNRTIVWQFYLIILIIKRQWRSWGTKTLITESFFTLRSTD